MIQVAIQTLPGNKGSVKYAITGHLVDPGPMALPAFNRTKYGKDHNNHNEQRANDCLYVFFCHCQLIILCCFVKVDSCWFLNDSFNQQPATNNYQLSLVMLDRTTITRKDGLPFAKYHEIK